MFDLCVKFIFFKHVTNWPALLLSYLSRVPPFLNAEEETFSWKKQHFSIYLVRIHSWKENAEIRAPRPFSIRDRHIRDSFKKKYVFREMFASLVDESFVKLLDF